LIIFNTLLSSKLKWYNCETPFVPTDRTCKIGGGLTAQYKHSANFLRVDIIVNKSGPWWHETWHAMAADAPWEASSLLIEGLGEVAICKWEQSVLPSACFSSHSLFLFFRLFWKSLIFAWTALSGFQSTGNVFLFCAPNFFLDRPFGCSVHRDALYCLSRIFRFSA